MVFDSRRLLSFLPRRATGALVLLLVLQTLLPAEARGCFPTTIRYSGPMVGDAMLIAIEPVGEDVQAKVLWPIEPLGSGSPEATFVLSTPAGEKIDSWSAKPLPGEASDELLQGALARVDAAGFEYRLELLDGEEVLDQLSFRVAVDCASAVCEYRLVPGLEGGPIAVSEAFWNALEKARASGSPDLLATVRKEHGEVAGEIPGFSWQLQRFEPTPGGDCSCRWVVVESFSAGEYIGPRWGPPPTHEAGGNLPGAVFLAGVQAKGAGTSVQRSRLAGRTVLGLRLLCTRALGATPAGHPTAWPSMPKLEIEERQLSTCPAPCTPQILHHTEFDGCAQGEAASRLGLPAVSRAEADATLILDGQSVMSSAAVVDIAITNNEVVRDAKFITDLSTATLQSEGAWVELESGGFLQAKASAPSSGQGGGYAFAAAVFDYYTLLHAPAICGIPQGTALIEMSLFRNQGGGVAMERWEDP